MIFCNITDCKKLMLAINLSSTHLSPVTVVPESISAGVDTWLDIGRRISLTNSVQAAHLSAPCAYTAALLVCNNALRETFTHFGFITNFLIFYIFSFY